MAKDPYAAKSIEQAHHWIAKAIDALEEARALIPRGQTRLGAYSRLYYSAHHAAVALLRLIGKSTVKRHQAIISEFGKQWIMQRSFPARYGKVLNTLYPGFPICLPQMAPLYARRPPSARNSVRRTIVQLQRPSPQPTLTWNRPEPLLSGHFSDTAPHVCPFFASLRCTRPRVSLPAPAAPRSSAASRRRAAGSDDLPPAGASSIWRASPAGLRFSPAAAGDSSATSA